MQCLLALATGLAGMAAGAQTAFPDAAPQIGQVSKDSVWVPTPERLIHRLLQMADTTRDDLVIDLGSGDGRMPIHAAKHFGARAVGVELEPNLVRLSNASAREQGVAHLTRFIEQDLFEADLSKAGVIALYLSPGAMVKLKPRLLGLVSGTRVVSHAFTLEDWEPDETIRVEGRMGYLWVVPADARGTWRVDTEGDAWLMRVGQKHQVLATTGERAGRPVNVVGAVLRGRDIAFTSFDRDGLSWRHTGRVEGDAMAGEAVGEDGSRRAWRARRD